jgi:hypothetical protein
MVIIEKSLNISMLAVADDVESVIGTESVQQLGSPLVYLSVAVGKQHEFLTHRLPGNGCAGIIFEFWEKPP